MPPYRPLRQTLANKGRENQWQLSTPLRPGDWLSALAAMGHLERFPPERLSGRCRIGQETSAGAYSGDGLAPKPVAQARLTFQNSGPVNSNFPTRLLR